MRKMQVDITNKAREDQEVVNAAARYGVPPIPRIVSEEGFLQYRHRTNEGRGLVARHQKEAQHGGV